MIICSYNLNDRISSIFQKIKENKMISILVLSFLIGIIIGSISIGCSKLLLFNDIKEMFKENFSAVSENSYLLTFSSSLLSIFIYIIAILLLSLSLWGGMIVPILPLLRGIGVGIAAGCLYLSYGIKGILFYILVLLPGAFLSSIILIIYTKRSMIFTNKLRSKFFPNSSLDKLWPDFRLYIKQTGLTFVYSMIVASMDAVLNFFLLRFFNFG